MEAGRYSTQKNTHKGKFLVFSMQNAGSLRKRRPRNLSTVRLRGGGGIPTSAYTSNPVDFDFHPKSKFRVPSPSENLTLSRSLVNSPQTKSKTAASNSNFDTDAVTTTTYLDTSKNKESKFLAFSRQYLLSYSTIFKLRLIIYLGRCVFLFPWSWRQRKSHLEIIQWPRQFRMIFYVFSAISFLLSSTLTVFHFHLLILNFKAAQGSYRLTFKCLEAICWHLHSAMLNVLLTIYRENMRCYINTLLSLNKELLMEYGYSREEEQSRKSFQQKGGKLFLNVTVPLFLVQVLVSFFRYIFFYDAPVYLTSYLGTKADIPLVAVALGALQDFWTSGQLVSGTLFLGWMTVAHAVSLEFWLQEAHRDNDTELTLSGLREPHEAFKLYRTLETLSVLYNHTVGQVAVPMASFMDWSAAIACGYVAVRSLNQLFIDEFPASLLYPLGITLTLCSVFSQFQMAAIMHDMSGSFLDSWSHTGDKSFRRFLISCKMINVEALGVASVTRGSLVTYLQTVSDHIIDCIMTFP